MEVDRVTMAAMTEWADTTAARAPIDTIHQLTEHVEQMDAWFKPLRGAHVAHLPVAYLFSGCDLFTARALFPAAPRYLLWAEFPVGDPRCFADEACAANATVGALGWLSDVHSKDFAVSVTSRMAKYFASPHGLLAGLLLSAHLLGMRLVGAAVHRSSYSGVSLRTLHGGQQHRVHYVSGHLPGRGPGGELQSFLAKAGFIPAVHIFKGGPKAVVRWLGPRLLANWSSMVVQDESGLDLQQFREDGWDVRLSGGFLDFVSDQKVAFHSEAKQLRAAYAAARRAGAVRRLPFRWGYHSSAYSAFISAVRHRRFGVGPQVEFR